MALSSLKTKHLGVFSLQGLRLHQLMIVNLEKTFIFVHLKSGELFVVSNLIKGMK